MATYKVHKTTSLPGTLEANSVYFVAPAATPNYVEIYVTNSAGSAQRRIPTEADIQALINSSIAGLGATEVVADIAARDALSLTSNAEVYVLDASADSTVTSGAAKYVWQQSNSTWHKVAEEESMDVVLAWSNITGGPSSTPAQIDAAVTNSHTHANKTQLDKVDEDTDGDMTYNGVALVKTGALGW